MFSFGIFTTHIPYIAFVVFYAYFLLFGVEKATKGEIQSAEKSIVERHQVVKYASVAERNNYYFQSDTDFYARSGFDFDTYFFKRKVKHWISAPPFFHQTEFYTSLSNRPPPSIA